MCSLRWEIGRRNEAGAQSDSSTLQGRAFPQSATRIGRFAA